MFSAFFVLLLLDKVTLSPFLDKINSLDIQIDGSEKEWQWEVYIDSQKENILNAYEDIKPYIEAGKTEEDALAVIMRKIEEMAKAGDVILLNMKPDAGRERVEPNYVVKKIALNIEGSQRDIIRFFYKVENSNYPLTINGVDFKLKDKKANLMKADLGVYFIYFTKAEVGSL